MEFQDMRFWDACIFSRVFFSGVQTMPVCGPWILGSADGRRKFNPVLSLKKES